MYLSIHYSHLWEQEKGKISFTFPPSIWEEKRTKKYFFKPRVYMTYGKTAIWRFDEETCFNRRCGKLKLYFHFLNLRVVDKAVTWVFFILPRQQFTGQERSGQLLGAQFHNKLQSVAGKPASPPITVSTRVVRAETSQLRWVYAQRLVLVCSCEVCTNQRNCRKGNPTVLLHQLL